MIHTIEHVADDGSLDVLRDAVPGSCDVVEQREVCGRGGGARVLLLLRQLDADEEHNILQLAQFAAPALALLVAATNAGAHHPAL